MVEKCPQACDGKLTGFASVMRYFTSVQVKTMRPRDVLSKGMRGKDGIRLAGGDAVKLFSLLGAVAIAFNATDVQAFPFPELDKPSQCQFTTTGTVTHGFRDLGDGIVEYGERAFGHGYGGATTSIEACGSGTVLRATTYEFEPDPKTNQKVVMLDAREASSEAIKHAISIPEPVSFGQLANQLKAVGAHASLVQSNRESCACNRAYPDLRGSKKQYER